MVAPNPKNPARGQVVPAIGGSWWPGRLGIAIGMQLVPAIVTANEMQGPLLVPLHHTPHQKRPTWLGRDLRITGSTRETLANGLEQEACHVLRASGMAMAMAWA